MKAFSLITLSVLLTACARSEHSQKMSDAPAPAGDGPALASSTKPTGTAETLITAAVQLAPTKGNTANGGLKITTAGSGVKLSGMVQGLQPNREFGFHFHEKGDCSAPDATSAGAHFNPNNQAHGNPRSHPHHAGDMLNVKSDEQGVAAVSIENPDVSLQSGQPNDILDKALVMHAKPDDYESQPAGNSGDRIACGVVTLQTN